MLLRLYKGTGPGQVILIILTAFCVWLNAFLHPALPVSFYYDIYPMPLYSLFKHLIGWNLFLATASTFALILIMIFLVTNFNTSHFFINERTFLPSVIFVLFTGIFPHYQILNPVLPASILLILAIRRIIESYRKPGIAQNFFDASFMIGTGSLFYANTIWFGILIFIGIAIFRTGNIKELIISVVGLITPLVLLAGIYYLSGLDFFSLQNTIYINLFSRTDKFPFNSFVIAGIVFMIIIIIISLVQLISMLNNKKIKSRKTFSTLIWALIICLTIYIAVPSASVELFWFAGVPVSYIIAHYLIFSRNKIVPEVIFGVIFLVIILMQILNLG